MTTIRKWLLRLAIGCALLQSATEANAQFFTNNGGVANNTQPVLPLPGAINAQSNLSAQQYQSMMMMRAMAGRRHGVQSGVPQDFGMMGSGGFGQNPIELQSPESPATSRKSSAQKRADARKLREDQKQALREDEKSKKTKSGKGSRSERAAK